MSPLHPIPSLSVFCSRLLEVHAEPLVGWTSSAALCCVSDSWKCGCPSPAGMVGTVARLLPLLNPRAWDQAEPAARRRSVFAGPCSGGNHRYGPLLGRDPSLQPLPQPGTWIICSPRVQPGIWRRYGHRPTWGYRLGSLVPLAASKTTTKTCPVAGLMPYSKESCFHRNQNPLH